MRIWSSRVAPLGGSCRFSFISLGLTSMLPQPRVIPKDISGQKRGLWGRDDGSFVYVAAALHCAAASSRAKMDEQDPTAGGCAFVMGMLPSKQEVVSGREHSVVLAGLLDGVWSELIAVVSSIRMSLGVPGLAGSGRMVDVLGVLCGDGE